MDIITDVYIVSDDPDLSNKINGSFPGNPFFHFYDIGSMKDRSAAYKLKGQFGERLDPFAVVFSKDKAVKAFYTEADDHVIESLIKYLKEQ